MPRPGVSLSTQSSKVHGPTSDLYRGTSVFANWRDAARVMWTPSIERGRPPTSVAALPRSAVVAAVLTATARPSAPTSRVWVADAVPVPVKRGDRACVIHTSGTGGAPKGVVLSHGAILSNVKGAARLRDVSTSDVLDGGEGCWWYIEPGTRWAVENARPGAQAELLIIRATLDERPDVN